MASENDAELVAKEVRLVVLYRGVRWQYLFGFDRGVQTGVLPDVPPTDLEGAKQAVERLVAVYDHELQVRWETGGQSWWLAKS